jgi:hypothetical protein
MLDQILDVFDRDRPRHPRGRRGRGLGALLARLTDGDHDDRPHGHDGRPDNRAHRSQHETWDDDDPRDRGGHRGRDDWWDD